MANILAALGGLGLFIYGMNLMGDSLQKAAGKRLREILGFLTKNKFMGILLGTVVTMIIQSSSATTVMVIGFVNAGLMNLTQAFSVIMGANLGTTVTSQIIAFRLTDIAPVAVAIGVALKLAFKTSKKKDLADIVIGFGLLFVGLNMMSQGLIPLQNSPVFAEMIVKLENPILGVFVGFLITTVLQSSSATMGILQATAMQGLIPFPVAFSIILGENIGTTTTAMISSIGASRNAKRAALLHFLFNVIGSIIFLAGLRIPVTRLVQSLTPDDIVRQIANAHTIFNLTNVLIQVPFANLHIKIVKALVKGEDTVEEKSLKYLDVRMIETPSVATNQLFKEIDRMFEFAESNIILSNDALVNKKFDLIDKIYSIEQTINYLNEHITEFIVRLNKTEISDEQRALNDIFLYALSDIERIGDHVKNINDSAVTSNDESINFSDVAKDELNYMFSLVLENIKVAKESFTALSQEDAKLIFKIEDEIDRLEETYRNSHIERLSDGTCDIKSGVMFLDVISNLERVSDHCVNIANYVVDYNKQERLASDI
ncbi:Na/Pi cotransporter family protein [Neofamilia massiliensis]|uniref:Na/Pi cotransporter family protein n=1 Tax=Neofamilia massiliensis TaxID=1673724 RepID=UPI0006BB6174|nr:Na/Pi cotransporter family protein [Neofamilia massiliensis]